jgi:hypothetical protein
VPYLLALLLLFSPAQSRSAPDLGRAGWAAINAGHAADAAAAFDEALKKNPTNPSLLLGAGVAAHLLGRADDARRWLSDALRIDPSLTSASLLLGDILYRAGDLDGAIGVYEQALANRPQNAQLAKKLEAWRKESDLHSRFGQRLGDHFTVLFEGPAEAKLAEKAVAILESAYWRIGTALNTYPVDVITVVLYTREQFRDITQSPSWAGGVFDGRIRLPVQGALQNPAEFERVLTHEFTHALVRAVAPRNVPQWLNEGLAVTFEGSPAGEREAQLRAAKTRPTLTSLEGSFAPLDRPAAVVAYAESAAAVQAMLDLGGANAISTLLTDLGRGLPFAEAFERNMLVSYAEFQRTLLSAR